MEVPARAVLSPQRYQRLVVVGSVPVDVQPGVRDGQYLLVRGASDEQDWSLPRVTVVRYASTAMPDGPWLFRIPAEAVWSWLLAEARWYATYERNAGVIARLPWDPS